MEKECEMVGDDPRSLGSLPFDKGNMVIQCLSYKMTKTTVRSIYVGFVRKHFEAGPLRI